MLLSQGNFRNAARKQCQAERHEVNKIIATFVFIQLESLNIRRPPCARLISVFQQQIEMRKCGEDFDSAGGRGLTKDCQVLADSNY